MRHLNKLFLIILLAVTFTPVAVYAQTYTALEPLPCIEGGGVKCDGGSGTYQSEFSFENYVQFIFNLVIAITAAMSVFMIVFGGFQYMTTDSWMDKKEGLTKVRHALLGLVLVLCSYLILRTVDPRLVAIPQRLVAPLNINYSATAKLTDLLNIIDQLAVSYIELPENSGMKKKITDARSAVSTLNVTKSRAEDEIRRIAESYGYSAKSVQELCNDTDLHNAAPELKQKCLALAQVNEELVGQSFLVYSESAKASMAGSVRECLSQRKEVSECKKVVNEKLAIGLERINGLEGQEGWRFNSQELSDYAAYLTGTLSMADAVKRLYPEAVTNNGNIILAITNPAVALGSALPGIITNFGRSNSSLENELERIYRTSMIKDPELKQALRKQVDSIKEAMKPR